MSESVWLSNLNFAGLRPVVPVPNSESKTQTPYQAPESQGTRLGPDASPNQPSMHDRLAADKPGDELSPDSTIWKLYVEEAKSQDEELAEGQNRNVDTLLLFAALFSAILTAFLIESKNLLQRDDIDTTALLLLKLVQSQQRVELGLPPSITTPTDIPPFTPSASARCINGMWFAALALSLSAALIAMLAKEWLAEFTASKLRSPREYALLRQARYDNFVQWRALHIIDLLPTLLHVSLLLFSIGLVVYLWTLDTGIAIFIAAVAGITTSFYFVTTLLGAFSATCPFVTQVSKYTERLAQPYLKGLAFLQGGSVRSHVLESEATTIEDIKALRWLAKDARDPSIGDCAYQALAGLKNREDLPSAANAMSTRSPLSNTEDPIPVVLDQNTLPSFYKASELDYPEELDSVFSNLCQKLSDAPTKNSRELAICQGTNIARYAMAVSKLVPHVDPGYRHPQSGSPTTRNGNPFHNSKELQKRPLDVAFDSLDRVWDNSCPPFSPDAYANLNAAEIKLTLVAVRLDGYENYANPEDTRARKHEEGRSDHHIIGTSSFLEGSSDADRIPIAKLRARYSRALARASFLLLYHNNGRAPISLYPILNLLESVHTACCANSLNPNFCLSTHQGETPDSDPEYYVNIVGVGSNRYLTSSFFGDWYGILAQLLELVSSAGAQGVTKIEHAASQALSAIAPVLLKQWSAINEAASVNNGIEGQDQSRRSREESQENSNIKTAHNIFTKATVDKQAIFAKVIANWPAEPRSDEKHEFVNWVLSQLLVLSVAGLSQADRPGAYYLPEIALKALCQRAESYSKYRAKDDGDDRTSADTTLIQQLILLVANADSTSNVPMAAQIYFLRFLTVQDKQRKSFLFYPGRSSSQELQALLKIIQRISERTTEGKLLLESFLKRQKLMPKEDKLDYFIRNTGTLPDLVHLGRQEAEYAPTVTNLLRDVIRAAQTDFILDSGTISDFLEAVSFILQPNPKPTESSVPQRSFVLDVFDVLKKGYDVSPDMVRQNHSALEVLEAALKNGAPEETSANMLLELREMRDRHATDLPMPQESKDDYIISTMG